MARVVGAHRVGQQAEGEQTMLWEVWSTLTDGPPRAHAGETTEVAAITAGFCSAVFRPEDHYRTIRIRITVRGTLTLPLNRYRRSKRDEEKEHNAADIRLMPRLRRPIRHAWRQGCLQDPGNSIRLTDDIGPPARPSRSKPSVTAGPCSTRVSSDPACTRRGWAA